MHSMSYVTLRIADCLQFNNKEHIYHMPFFFFLSVSTGDGRMDSPGFCAQYCTYSAMENETKKIIYNPKSEKVGTVWKTPLKKESSDF